MALFEQFPYANFHELNLDWTVRTVKELADKWANTDPDELERELKNYVDEQVGTLGQLKHEHAYNSIEIYVDCVNGSNVNGNGTIAHPYYSIAKALEIMDQTGAGLVIKLVSSGVYTINKAQFAACSIEFQALATGITLAWMDSASTRTHHLMSTSFTVQGFYDGTTLFTALGTGDLRMEGSNLMLATCAFTGDADIMVRAFGGSIFFNNVALNIGIQLYGASMLFADGEVTDTQRSSARPIYGVYGGSVLALTGVINLKSLDAGRTSALISADNSTLFLNADNQALVMPPLGIHRTDATNTAIWQNDPAYYGSPSTWDNVTLNGVFYDTFPINMHRIGTPTLLQAAANYGTAYPTDGFNHIGVKVTMSYNGASGTTFVNNIYRNVNNNWHVLVGFVDNMMFRLNCQFVGTNFRIVSCTEYELDAGSFITGQSQNITFDIYGID